jgi:hypothetical protein
VDSGERRDIADVPDSDIWDAISAAIEELWRRHSGGNAAIYQSLVTCGSRDVLVSVGALTGVILRRMEDIGKIRIVEDRPNA